MIESLGEKLCPFCPWTKGEINKLVDELCEGVYCEYALDNFIDKLEESI